MERPLFFLTIFVLVSPREDGRSTVGSRPDLPRACAQSILRAGFSDMVHGGSTWTYDRLQRVRSVLHQAGHRVCRVGAFKRCTLEHLGRMKGRRAEPGGTDSALERL